MNTTISRSNLNFSIRFGKVISYDPITTLARVIDTYDNTLLTANVAYSIIPRAPHINDIVAIASIGVDNIIIGIVPNDDERKKLQLLPSGSTSIKFDDENYINIFNTIFEIVYNNIKMTLSDDGGLGFLQGKILKFAIPVGFIELNNENKSITITYIKQTIFEKYQIIFNENELKLRYIFPDLSPILSNEIKIKRTGIELTAGPALSPMKAGVKLNMPTQVVTISGSFLNIATGGISISLPFSPDILVGQNGIDIRSDNKLAIRINTTRCPEIPIQPSPDVPPDYYSEEELPKRREPCYGPNNLSEIILENGEITIKNQSGVEIKLTQDNKVMIKASKVIIDTPNPVQINSGKIADENNRGIQFDQFSSIKDLKNVLLQIITTFNNHTHPEPDGSTGPPSQQISPSIL